MIGGKWLKALFSNTGTPSHMKLTVLRLNRLGPVASKNLFGKMTGDTKRIVSGAWQSPQPAKP